MTVDDRATKLEKDVIRFLRKLSFRDVGGGADFRVGGRQIDACGGHEKTLLIVECTTQQDLTTKLDEFSGRLGEIINGCKKSDTYSRYSKFRPVMVIDDREISTTLLDKANQKTPTIHIWNRSYLNYYFAIQKSVGDYAKFGILADLDVKPESHEEITIPAFSIDTGKKGKLQLFTFIIDAKELLRVSYVARRESGGEQFYQRMVKTPRLKKIARYVEKGKLFPNSIVVALEKGVWKFNAIESPPDSSPNWMTLGELSIYNSYRACWLIDGQHRLLSYAHTDLPGKLVVSAFAGISLEDQAEYFLDINKEAKPVDPNLLWDILGSTNPTTKPGIISNSVKRLRSLDGSLFKNNIRVPSLGEGKYKFNNICSTIDKSELAEEQIGTKYKKSKNPFWDNNPEKAQRNIASGINELFSFISAGLHPESRSRVLTDGFVSVAILLYKLLVVELMARPKPEELKETFQPLVEYLNSLDREETSILRKKLSSEGGKTDFRNEVIGLIRESGNNRFGVGLVDQKPSFVDKIASLELEINSYVNSVFTEHVGSDWFENLDFDPKQKQIAIQRSRKYHEEAWEQLNFLSTITSIILKKEWWEKYFREDFISCGFGSEDEVETFAKMLWEFRSRNTHKRNKPVLISRERETLLKSAYLLFSRVSSLKPQI